MPNRVIKESIKSSPQIDSLTWFEEVVFYRLIVSVDDYGCYDGRIVFIKNDLFPTRENVTTKSVSDAIDKLASAGLLCKYTVNGMPYLFFPTWKKHQRVRTQRHKYPAPPADFEPCDNLPQSAASCGELPPKSNPIRIQSESESNPKDSAGPQAARAPIDYGFGEKLSQAFADWLQYKQEKRQGYKPKGLENLVAQVKAKARQYGEDPVADLIAECMASNWQGIIWDKLEKKVATNARQKASGATRPQPTHGEADQRAREDMKRLWEMLKKDKEENK